MNISSRKSTLIALLVAGAFFMENLDGTVIATALPQMGRSFHVSPVDLNMGMTAYMLMLGRFSFPSVVGLLTVLVLGLFLSRPSRFSPFPPFFADSARGFGNLRSRESCRELAER